MINQQAVCVARAGGQGLMPPGNMRLTSPSSVLAWELEAQVSAPGNRYRDLRLVSLPLAMGPGTRGVCS